jgi:DNA-binding phage protein
MANAFKRKKIKTVPFNVTETLDTPEAVDEYVMAAFETNDPSFIAKAIRTAARARGLLPRDRPAE